MEAKIETKKVFTLVLDTNETEIFKEILTKITSIELATKVPYNKTLEPKEAFFLEKILNEIR